MRFIFTCFTWLIIFNTTPACSNAQKSIIKKYYGEINLAELSIVDSNYSNAILHYKNAFELLPESSEKDIYNAAVLGYIARDTQFAMLNMNKLAHFGYALGCLIEQSKWGAAVKNDAFFKNVSSNYDSIYNASLNSELDRRGQELSSFYRKDQNVRKDGAYGTPEIKYSDSLNMKLFHDYIQEKGFPSFRNSGFYDMGRSSIYFNGTVFFMMWHWRGAKTPIDSLAYKAVMEGDFDPKLYSALMDMHQEEPSFFTMINKSAISKEEEIKINRKRDEIYLEPLSDYKKKLAYQKSESWFILVPKMIWAYNRLIQDTKLRANSGK